MTLPKFRTPTESRSSNMSAIRSFGNKTTEARLRAALAQHGIGGWALHSKTVLGFPDFYFCREKLAVFVDGCFWHGCPKCGHIPKTNVGYWRKKILRNKRRDVLIRRALRAGGFSVLRIWECELKRSPRACVSHVTRALRASAAVKTRKRKM